MQSSRRERNNRITTIGLVMVLELIVGVNPITGGDVGETCVWL